MKSLGKQNPIPAVDWKMIELSKWQGMAQELEVGFLPDFVVTLGFGMPQAPVSDAD